MTSQKDPEKPQSSPPVVEPTASSNSNQQGVSLSSLKRLAVKGSIWVMFSFGISQGLRLVGNVILTRLLSPELFGMMAIVHTLLLGLQMFSDVGLGPNIIQNKRGEEPVFLRTAWSIQVIRGFILSLLAAILAWPLAFFNNEPDLVLVTTVVGLTAIISGFNSTWLLVYSRRMTLNKLVPLELIAYSLSLICMVIWAFYFPSVWALVIGSFVGSIIKLFASHTFFAGVPMRFNWEYGAVRELIRFGRWIFISTAVGFFGNRLDVFVIGNLAGMKMLGMYMLAKNLSQLATQALMKLSTAILLPVYSRLAERGTKTLRSRTLKVRILLLLLALPPIWILILWGNDLIALLYDERYQEASWMLPILACGATALVIRTTIGPVLLAVGDSFRHMIVSTTHLIFKAIGMTLGFFIADLLGLLVGGAIAELFTYIVLVYLSRPYGVWLPILDIMAFGSSFVVIVIAFNLN